MTMRLKHYSAPATEPITTAEAQAHCRIVATATATPLNYNGVTPTGSVNGVNKDFVLPATPNSDPMLVFLNNIYQRQNYEYTLATATITFAIPPITGDTIKVWFRSDSVSVDPDEQYLQNCIKAAREYCEEIQNRSYITQTWNLTLDEFPDDDYIELPRPPLVSINSITYLDENGTERTLSTSVYGVDTQGEPGRVYLKYGQEWPTTYDQANSITIQYLAGYGAASAVPMRIKQAILLMIAHMFENRDGVSTIAHAQVPIGVDSLLWVDRVVAV
jgi:uncharacterized phiE125 gp8 family phage protein